MSRADAVCGVPVARNNVMRRSVPSPVWIESGGGTTVTAHATAHTKGAWTELITATDADANLLVVGYDQVGVSATDTSMLIDVGIGAAAAEVVLIANCGGGYVATDSGPSFGVPVRIPKGSRLSVRAQSLVSADTIRAYLQVWNLPNLVSPTLIDTYGADTAVSGPTTALTSNNTYYQITAATTQAYQGIVFIPGALPGATAMTSTTRNVTLAVGASGAEVALSTFVFATNNSELLQGGFDFTNHLYRGANPTGNYVAGHIPAGSRLAVKLDTGAAYVSCYLLGVPYS